MPSTKRKVVAVDVTPLLYRRTGIARITQALMSELRGLDTELDFVAFGRRLLGPPGDVVGGGITYHRLRLPRCAEGLIQKVGAVERACKADIYHATDFYLPLRQSSAAVATIHDLLFLTDPEDSVDHARLRRWVPSFVQQCGAVIAISQFVKKQVETVLNVDAGRVHVVHPGVDRGVFAPCEDMRHLRESLNQAFGLSAPYFLAVSCSAGRKNTPLLLETYVELLKRKPRHSLVLAWDAPAHIRAAYTSYPGIRFLGHVSDEALRLLYCGASALIFPSNYEGFGLPVIEAMSCGTPVVTSKVTSLPEAGGEAAIYIDPRSPATLFNVLLGFEQGILRAADLRPRLIEHARRFSWKECARRTLEVYEVALDRGTD